MCSSQLTLKLINAFHLDENQVKVMFLAYYSRTGLVDKNRLFVYNGIENYWARANRVKEENQVNVLPTVFA